MIVIFLESKSAERRFSPFQMPIRICIFKGVGRSFRATLTMIRTIYMEPGISIITNLMKRVSTYIYNNFEEIHNKVHIYSINYKCMVKNDLSTSRSRAEAC